MDHDETGLVNFEEFKSGMDILDLPQRIALSPEEWEHITEGHGLLNDAGELDLNGFSRMIRRQLGQYLHIQLLGAMYESEGSEMFEAVLGVKGIFAAWYLDSDDLHHELQDRLGSPRPRGQGQGLSSPRPRGQGRGPTSPKTRREPGASFKKSLKNLFKGGSFRVSKYEEEDAEPYMSPNILRATEMDKESGSMLPSSTKGASYEASELSTRMHKYGKIRSSYGGQCLDILEESKHRPPPIEPTNPDNDGYPGNTGTLSSSSSPLAGTRQNNREIFRSRSPTSTRAGIADLVISQSKTLEALTLKVDQLFGAIAKEHPQVLDSPTFSTFTAPEPLPDIVKPVEPVDVYLESDRNSRHLDPCANGHDLSERPVRVEKDSESKAFSVKDVEGARSPNSIDEMNEHPGTGRPSSSSPKSPSQSSSLRI
eukprot:CAMPEP_0184303716 /NCGR_PEP_ID=MMETSP1049-20130417/13414_1 /TAXON_ID=77928 /ORGANISM="Proteomonas sulcata, Strain CCMP704" /LENGTH=424 /DNA_ID=CAMNT_0026615349 /DNA_START=532 /DNA_END=1806 /DNA_ORIENTATION=+